MMLIRPTKPTDFEVFTPAHHDILEAKALGIEPSFPDASECVTLSLNGFPLAIGGNVGSRCWFVTSDQVWRLNRKYKLKFRKLIMEHRDMLLEKYECLWNFVWVGNTSHIRFLKSIGAVFHDEYSNDRKLQLFTIGGNHEGMLKM
ncbi:scaffold protein [Yersinia phage vB_YenP_Rambo]|uniref:Scaffold protein n=1 Tax=Yersinia phage vB_YenP_Rambo TaxID=2880894 RepID=A0AC61TNT9_9CAUD|nr:scaffold protein [Yersinia phage vB_YenP_Rambo]